MKLAQPAPIPRVADPSENHFSLKSQSQPVQRPLTFPCFFLCSLFVNFAVFFNNNHDVGCFPFHVEFNFNGKLGRARARHFKFQISMHRIAALQRRHVVVLPSRDVRLFRCRPRTFNRARLFFLQPQPPLETSSAKEAFSNYPTLRDHSRHTSAKSWARFSLGPFRRKPSLPAIVSYMVSRPAASFDSRESQSRASGDWWLLNRCLAEAYEAASAGIHSVRWKLHTGLDVACRDTLCSI